MNIMVDSWIVGDLTHSSAAYRDVSVTCHKVNCCRGVDVDAATEDLG